MASSSSAAKDLKRRLAGSGKTIESAGMVADNGTQNRSSSSVLDVAEVYSDHMVLQRSVRLPVWGKAAPGAAVTVEFADQRVQTRAGADGSWRAYLEPLEPEARPREMTIFSGAETLVVRDILVGEVWHISGQSNMAITGRLKLQEISERKDFFGDAAPALTARLNETVGKDDFQLRFIREQQTRSAWKRCVGDDTFDCPLIGLFFARRLRAELGIPVGIVSTAFGCASLETYIPRASLLDAGFDELVAEGDRFQELVDRGGVAALPQKEMKAVLAEHCRHPRYVFCRGFIDDKGEVDLDRAELIAWHMSVVKSMAVFNSTVTRVLPFPMRGMLWYQGETNVGDAACATKLRLLIESYRKLSGNPEMPFFAVLVAPHNFSEPLPRQWTLFYRAAAEIPGCALVNTADTPPAEQLDYHPFSKDFLGERLARLALRQVYGNAKFSGKSPFVCATEAHDDKLVVRFRNAEGLAVTDELPPKCFEVAGEDKKFFPAQAQLDGETVILASPQVARPRFARYAWSNLNDGANLRNRYDLSLFPFDTSDPFFLSEEAKRIEV